ncbi:serine-rich adhesin for platelets-like isoform X3 [Lytechinus variegatus]|uniref:serine-rich adhesin for platelets-like isoform X3 n=1 Tax=Lytechinus variegatus TaxID=7654 RepID=UPI001BB28F15|nr:serine-rich adhesin for platelets-like isoform X3 [Lytechinus variegatus]
MSSYAGLDEIGLRKLLDTSSDITERRKIRAALRELRTNNNNSVVNPHIRTPISPSKLSHHQSFRTERRRRPEIDDVTKKQSQDDDILYRSRRRREIDAGRGQGGGGDEGDDENEVVVDIEMKIKEIGSDEQKLTKLLSETRDFNDRRKVRSAIREVKRKTRQQDDCDATIKPTNQSQAQPPAETAVTVLQENQTNLALSRSTEGQRSSSEGQDLTQETSRRDIDQEIEALQKQLEGAETYEERRKLRTEIRELRQKKTGIANDVTQPLLPPEQLSLNQENGMGHLVRSKVSGVCDQEEGKLNGVDGFDQVPSSPMDEDETDQHEQCYYAAVNRSSEDEVNDVNTDAIQDREYAEPTFPSDPNHGYAELQTHCPVVKEEPIYNPATDCVVDSHGAIVDEEEKTKPIITVDTIPNKTEVVDKSGLADTSSSSSQNRKSDNIYEIITPMEIKPEYAEIKKEVPVDVCENDTKICQSVTKEEIPLDSPDLIKTLPDVPLKSKPLAFQKKEEKMEQKKVEVAKKNEVEVVRNLLPSEIKKQQVGPKGLKVNRSNVNKPNTVSPPKPAQTPPQNTVTSSNIEVVHRPPGSRRARIINSYLELERIKREGVSQSDGKPIQISAPNMALMSKMKGAGGGLRGSDEMLEDMINLQLMQAMGVNPHTIATPPIDKTSKSTPPQRPSHLPIPTPIKTTKPLPKQPASRHQTSGPSHGIAKMLNRFGESSAPTPKPGFQGFHSSGKTGATPVSKGLKKPPAFNIEIKDGELEVNIKDDNRQLLMNKLGVHSRGKGLSLPRTSNNSPSYNNNSSNTNSNNSRGLSTTQGFESSIKPDGAIILKNHGVREEEEESSGKPANVRRTNAETKETPLVVADDLRRAKEEEKGKHVTGETSDERPASSSSPQTPLASFKECSGKDEDRVASTSEEKVSVSNGNQYGGDVSEEHEIVEASLVPVSPSILSSSSSSSSSSPSSSSASPSSSSSPPSSPPPSQPSSINTSPLSSQTSDLPEPRDDRDSVEKEPVKPQESKSSDTESDSEKIRCETPNQDECGPESIPGPVLETKENVEMDADDEASKGDNIQTTKQAKPIPAVRKTKPETKTSQISSSPSSSPSSSASSSSSSSSSGTSSSGSSSELDEVTGQPKEKRKHIGLKEAMRRRAQLKATELAKQSTKEVKKVELEETCSQEEPSSVSKAVKTTKDETEKIDRTIDGDTKNSDDSLVSKATENLAVESTLEVKDVGDVKASKKQDDGSATKEDRDEETSSSQSPVSSVSSSYTESGKVKAPSEDKTVSNDADSISKVKDTTGTVSSQMTLHSPVTSTTTFPISNSTSPSTSTSENISSVIEVTPKMSERVQSTSQSLSPSSGSQLQKASSPASEDSHDGAVLSVNKTNSSEHTPIRSSPDTSTTPSIPRNFGHPFRFHKTRDDNAIPTPKKTTTSVKRSESAVSSLQAKRNKFNRPRPDDDTSPTSSTPARSFKNVVSGSKFAALREKFSASNGNSNNSAGQGKHGGHSPSPSTTPKSLWQQKSPSSSSRFGSSISEESSPDTSEQKKSIYGTPPSSPLTPLPYMTPPESPLDFKGKTSTPLASSTPTGAAELKSPTAAELKRQFLFGREDSQQGDVFVDEKGAKDENSNLKDSMAPIEQIDDEAALEKMLEEATEFDERKKIRSRLREVRKKKRDEREQKALEQERAFEEKMHKLEVESAQQRMRAVGLNVQKTPVDSRTKTVTETKDDGKTKTVVETTMRDSGSSKSVQMTIMSKTEDEGFKSQTLQQESKSISVGPGGSSSVTMSKSVSSSSSSTTSTTDKPKGRPKTKFEEEMEVKKREREEKRKQDEAKFKEQQMQRKKEAYELKKKQAEDAKNRKAALFNKFGGAGGGAKPAGGGGGGMRVQNATTIKQKLLEWAQRVTRGYSGVNVTNFSSSWADGMAFCAVIHHYYPDSFDFNTLDPKQRRKNFDLAFNTAEEQADIMPLLDTDDMIMMKNNPDWKCVFTYVQSLYRHLNK